MALVSDVLAFSIAFTAGMAAGGILSPTIYRRRVRPSRRALMNTCGQSLIKMERHCTSSPGPQLPRFAAARPAPAPRVIPPGVTPRCPTAAELRACGGPCLQGFERCDCGRFDELNPLLSR